VHVLIGYDGSPGADAALEDLARAGLPPALEAVVLSTAETWLAPRRASPPGEAKPADDQRTAAARALAERGAARLRPRFPGWQITTEAGTGSPSLALIQRAEALHADLIVVGVQSRGVLGDLVLGSVAQKVVSEARTSVRIGRAPARADRPPRLILGLDGSSCSEAAVISVTARSWPAGTLVRLVTATGAISLPPPPSHRNEPTADERSRREQELVLEEAHQFQERARLALAARGLETSSVIKEGDPKHLIVSEARSWEADCVFVGSTGLSRFERLILGSVSAAVVPRAPCSVEVVRARPRSP
jgi:nucleotide-binding universal stress UspA family protein